MGHTPEPWAFDHETVSVRYDGRGKDTEGNQLGCTIVAGKYRDDMQRIVACVNACTGMADPAKEIAEMSDRIAALEARCKVLGEEVRAWRAWKTRVVRYITAEVPDPTPLIDELKSAVAATDAAKALEAP